MKPRKYILLISFGLILLTALLMSCSTTTKIANRSGSELWSANCGRCHNAPPSSTYSPEQWEVIGLHMKTRALITDIEKDKIVAFFKAGQ